MNIVEQELTNLAQALRQRADRYWDNHKTGADEFQTVFNQGRHWGVSDGLTALEEVAKRLRGEGAFDEPAQETPTESEARLELVATIDAAYWKMSARAWQEKVYQRLPAPDEQQLLNRVGFLERRTANLEDSLDARSRDYAAMRDAVTEVAVGMWKEGRDEDAQRLRQIVWGF